MSDHIASGDAHQPPAPALAPPPSVAQVAVTCDLVKTYREATAFVVRDDSFDLATTYNPATNTTELFLIGTDGRVYAAFVDPDSDTGWSSQDLQFPGQATSVAAGTFPDGSRIVYAVDGRGTLYSRRCVGSTWDDAWHGYTPLWGQMKFGQWENLVTGAYVQGVVFHNGVPVPLLKASDDEGVPTWLFCLEGDQLQLIGWARSSLAVPGLIATPDGAGAVGAFYYDGPENKLYAITAGNANYQPAIAGGYLPTARVAGANGLDGVLATDSDQYRAFYFDVDPSSATLVPLAIPFARNPNLQMRHVVGRRGSSGLLEVFARMEDGTLQHVAQDPSRPTGWTAAVPLPLDRPVAWMTAGRNSSDQSEIFAVTTDHAIWHIWRDDSAAAPDSDPVWHCDPVEMGNGGVIEETVAYAAQILLFDAQGQLVTGATATISSDDGVWVEVNGIASFVDRRNPLQVQSNALGQVMITVPTTAVGVPALYLWADGMPAGDRVSLNLSGGIEAQLRHPVGAAPGTRLTGPLLAAATIQDDEGVRAASLVPAATKDLPAVANAINASIDLLKNAGSHEAQDNPSFFHAGNDARITRYVRPTGTAPLPRSLHLPSIPDRAWRLSRAAGGISFAALSPAEVQSYKVQVGASARLMPRMLAGQLATARTGRSLSNLTLQAALDKPDDQGWSWGDIWQAVKSGLATVLDVVVTPVLDAVEAAITIVVGAATYVFNCVISLVEQVFEVISEALRWVGVDLDKVWRWLGEVTGWQAVLRTNDVIRAQMVNAVQLTALAVPVLQNALAGKLMQFGQWTDAQLDAIIEQAVGAQSTFATAAAFAQTKTPPDIAQRVFRAQGMNSILNGFVNNMRLAQPVTPQPGARANVALAAAAAPPAAGPVADLIALLSSTDSQWASSGAFSDAVGFIRRMQTDRQHVMQLAVAAIASVCKGILQLVLDAAIQILAKLAAALVATLNELAQMLVTPFPLKVPLLSALCRKMTGRELSPSDLSSLLVAMPTTWLYRAANGAPPFPDDASRDRFMAAYSTSHWARSLGIQAPAARALAATRNAGSDPPSPEELTVADRVIPWMKFALNSVYLPADLVLDAVIDPTLAVKYNLKYREFSDSTLNVATGAMFGIGAVGVVCGLPWNRWSVATVFNPCGGKAEDVAILHRYVDLAELAVSTVWMLVFRSLPRADAKVGPFVASGFGVVHLFLSLIESGMAAAEGEPDALDAVGGAFGSIPLAVKFLHSTPVIEATEGWAYVALLIIDGVGDTVLLGCDLAQAINVARSAA